MKDIAKMSNTELRHEVMDWGESDPAKVIPVVWWTGVAVGWLAGLVSGLLFIPWVWPV